MRKHLELPFKRETPHFLPERFAAAYGERHKSFRTVKALIEKQAKG